MAPRNKRGIFKTAGSYAALVAVILLSGQWCLTETHADTHAETHGTTAHKTISALSAEARLQAQDALISPLDAAHAACCHPPSGFFSKRQTRDLALSFRPAPIGGNSSRIVSQVFSGSRFFQAPAFPPTGLGAAIAPAFGGHSNTAEISTVVLRI